MTPTVTGNWQASTLNQSSRLNKSQNSTFKMKRAAQISSRRRITLKTLQKRKKCTARIATSHHKLLDSRCRPAITAAKAAIAAASITEKRKPQVRNLFMAAQESQSHRRATRQTDNA